MGPLTIEQVLAAEAENIHDLSDPKIAAIIAELNRLAAKPEIEKERRNKDADERSGKDEKRLWIDNRKAFYRALGNLNRGALCFSGGGIRSATFCLGIIQALAQYTVTGKPAERDRPGVAPTPEQLEARANESMLSRFHYLSTVSGGGYIGSWLSAWRHRNDFPTVWRNLASRPDGPDVEPPEISWLRAYSNYLTPKVGLFSADTWTGVAIYIRNLLLNWMIIIPAIAVVLLVLKIVITGSVGLARIDIWWPHFASLLVGLACLIVAQAFTTHYRPTRRPPPPKAAPGKIPEDSNNVDQWRYLRHGLIWSLLSALLVTSSFTSAVGVELSGAVSKFVVIGIGAVLGIVIYAGGWIAGWPEKSRWKDFLRWSSSGAVYGGLVGLGAWLFTLMQPYAVLCPPSVWNLVVPIVFGVPWVLFSQLFADMVFVGLVSYEANSDSDREWLGRAAGWQAATAIIWILATAITFAGGYLLIKFAGPWIGTSIGAAGGASGIITAWLGKKGSGDSKPKLEKQPTSVIARKFGMALAGPIFAALLVVGISVVLDLMLLGDSLVIGLTAGDWSYWYIFGWLVGGLTVAYVIALIASRTVNINRFSIHALYRNRLVRGYLGASRQNRFPDRFTGFDNADNPNAYELWPPVPVKPEGPNTYCLFHVVNITLNIVEATRLAWQQRKAESFTVSPLHSGTFYKGYRPSEEYGSPRGGISLGTAMAISGAAASPNMGYNSSTSITLLLALFNVRLGWWLGNPGTEGDGTYKLEGPRTAIRPLVEETFGLTTDTKPWVYLSDGGHFENLGIYEMVRRRNRVILVVDGGCDPEYKFEDLGNAIRKIYIDLGIRIYMKDLDRLRNRPTEEMLAKASEALAKAAEALAKSKKDGDGKPDTPDKPAAPDPCEPSSPIPYITAGSIDYTEADGEGAEPGVLIYVKPAYHGVSSVEDAGVRSYANDSPTFPHEPTGDQWFTESQFESYRSLAFEIARTFMKGQKVIQPKDGVAAVSLGDLLASLTPTARQGGTPAGKSPPP